MNFLFVSLLLPTEYLILKSPSTDYVHHWFSDFYNWSEHSRRWRLLLSSLLSFFTSLITVTQLKWQEHCWMGFECSTEHRWGVLNDNICTWIRVHHRRTCSFYFPTKKDIYWKYTLCSKCDKKRQVFVCVSGKESFKAGHRDEKKNTHSSSPLLSPPPHLLPHPLFLLFSLRGLENIGSGHGMRREHGRTREEMLSVVEEEEKARGEERWELGTRFDPCLLINLSERDRKRARVREIERWREEREPEMDPSAEVFTRWFEVQIHFSSSSSSFSPSSSSLM